jgi:hypothetical protein
MFGRRPGDESARRREARDRSGASDLVSAVLAALIGCLRRLGALRLLRGGGLALLLPLRVLR